MTDRSPTASSVPRAARGVLLTASDVATQAGVAAVLRRAGCVFAEEEAALLDAAARSPAELGDLVRRRADGLPLEQVLGWASFGGLRVAVVPGVFVPRRRTELLVEEAARLLRAGRHAVPAVVVDLCCGSGAVGLAVAARAADAAPPVRLALHAADIDPAAVACAQTNLAALGDGQVPGTTARVYLGDLDEALPRSLLGRVDLLTLNAPYVPTAEIPLLPPEARSHEPLTALDGGPDGLTVQRRVAGVVARWLAPGGHVLVETSARQAGATAALLAAAGLATRTVRDDALDATVVVGRAGIRRAEVRRSRPRGAAGGPASPGRG